jgi:galactokinase
VQARQTHYSDGFALLLPTHMGTTVALRRAETSRLAFAPKERVWAGASASAPPWVRVAHRVLTVVCEGTAFEVGVVSSVPPGCRDGYWAGLAVALIRAIQALGVPTVLDIEQADVLRDALVPRLATEVAHATEQPYGPAYLLSTFAGARAPVTLVDTETRESLPVRTDARSALRWALVDPAGGRGERLQTPAGLRRRKDQAEAALARLRREGFEGLTSFRNLEHRDLERATRVLPPSLQPIVRHLVTENRRVQKHVAALRRSDWQMVGALLLMSHASLRDDWGGTTPAANALVEGVESHTHDGLYGACMTERGGGVLVVGRPHVFEDGLRELTRTVAAPEGAAPTVYEL